MFFVLCQFSPSFFKGGRGWIFSARVLPLSQRGGWGRFYSRSIPFSPPLPSPLFSPPERRGCKGRLKKGEWKGDLQKGGNRIEGSRKDLKQGKIL